MVNLKGVYRVTAKGRSYYYAWRGGPRLDGEPGSAEFLASLEDARSPLAGLDRRKLSAWITLYKASPEWNDLAKSTKRRWAKWLDQIRADLGGHRVAALGRPSGRAVIKHWRDKWRTTPRTADYGKQVLSRVLSFAVEEGAIAMNPCSGVSNLYSVDRGDIIWEPGDIEKICAHTIVEIARAVRLAAWTGLRQGDLLALSWPHVGTHSIEMKTGKSRRRRAAIVPITGELRALLDGLPKHSTTVLVNSRRRPWKSGFASSWNKAMLASGLKAKGLHFHDLRGTFATNLYRAGFTVREIAETLGWTEERVERLIDRYVKRDEIMRDRIRRLESVPK